MDMTLAWRALMRIDPAAADATVLDAVYYDEARRQACRHRCSTGCRTPRLRRDPLAASERQAKMAAANPLYVLRNWLAQEAIDRRAGDLGGVHALQDVLRDPYTERAGLEHFAGKRPAWPTIAPVARCCPAVPEGGFGRAAPCTCGGQINSQSKSGFRGLAGRCRSAGTLQLRPYKLGSRIHAADTPHSDTPHLRDSRGCG